MGIYLGASFGDSVGAAAGVGTPASVPLAIGGGVFVRMWVIMSDPISAKHLVLE